LGLPFLPVLIDLSRMQYGVLAGLTVYAVPQVLAATTPLGSVAVQIGTLVKLVRVLMLGPVVLLLSILARQWRDKPGNVVARVTPRDRSTARELPPLHRMVPWYIAGFLVLAGLRSADLVPQAMLLPIAAIANFSTIVSMAALGLGTDLRSVARAGVRVTATVALSLLVLGFISFGLIRLLGIS
jgi:uncharacterized membrane protein YadS